MAEAYEDKHLKCLPSSYTAVRKALACLTFDAATYDVGVTRDGCVVGRCARMDGASPPLRLDGPGVPYDARGTFSLSFWFRRGHGGRARHQALLTTEGNSIDILRVSTLLTSAVLRLECSIDCISGSVAHQQNMFRSFSHCQCFL